KVKPAQSGRGAGRAGGWQDVVRAADIIADRLGRVGPEENGAGVAYAAGQTLSVLTLDLEMLRGDGVDERHSISERADQDNGAEIAPGGGGDRGTRQRAKLRADGRLHRAGERGVIRDQDRLAARTIL